MKGLAKAKAEGRTGGRPVMGTQETKDQIKRLRVDGMSIRKIAAEAGFSKATVQRELTS